MDGSTNQLLLGNPCFACCFSFWTTGVLIPEQPVETMNWIGAGCLGDGHGHWPIANPSLVSPRRLFLHFPLLHC